MNLCVLAKEEIPFKPATQTVFFASIDVTNVQQRLFFSYSKVLESDNILSNANKKVLAKEFGGWMGQYFTDDYVPDTLFIEKNIVLYPADNKTRFEDVAMLPFRTPYTDYLVVQTGGVDAKMWLYKREKNGSGAIRIQDAEGVAEQTLFCILKDKTGSFLPELEIKARDGFYMGRPSKGLKKGKNYITYAVSGKESCFVFQKKVLNGKEEEWLPNPDNWFSSLGIK
jgi:hypothetical protein